MIINFIENIFITKQKYILLILINIQDNLNKHGNNVHLKFALFF